MATQIIGLVMGAASVTMFQESGSKAVIQREALEPEVFANGKIWDADKLAEIIAGMRSAGSFSGRDVSFVLPPQVSYFKIIESVPVTEAELKLNMSYEFRDYISTSKDDYFYDYAMDEVISDEEGKVTGIRYFAGAASKAAIAEYRALLDKAGLKLKTAIPREMSYVYLFRDAIEKGRVEPGREYCIIRIGTNATEVNIFVDGKPAAYKLIDVLKTDTERLSVEILKTVNFYLYENHDSNIDTVYFCGTDSGADTLKAEILERINATEGSIYDILPVSCNGKEDARRAITAVGAVL